MKLDITTLEGKSAGSVDLNETIFGLDPRADLLARCVRWQLAKRQAGTHAVEGPFGHQPDDQEVVQAEGHRQRPPRRRKRSPVPGWRSRLRSASFAPMRTTCRRRSARLL